MFQAFECTVWVMLVGRDCRDRVGQCEETINGTRWGTNSHDHSYCNIKTHTVSSWKKIQHACRLDALGDKMFPLSKASFKLGYQFVLAIRGPKFHTFKPSTEQHTTVPSRKI